MLVTASFSKKCIFRHMIFIVCGTICKIEEKRSEGG